MAWIMDHGDREPRRTIKSKSNARSRGRATYRHFVRTTALLRDGSPRCLGMHQRQSRRLHSKSGVDAGPPFSSLRLALIHIRYHGVSAMCRAVRSFACPME